MVCIYESRPQVCIVSLGQISNVGVADYGSAATAVGFWLGKSGLRISLKDFRLSREFMASDQWCWTEVLHQIRGWKVLVGTETLWLVAIHAGGSAESIRAPTRSAWVKPGGPSFYRIYEWFMKVLGERVYKNTILGMAKTLDVRSPASARTWEVRHAKHMPMQ